MCACARVSKRAIYYVTASVSQSTYDGKNSQDRQNLFLRLDLIGFLEDRKPKRQIDAASKTAFNEDKKVYEYDSSARSPLHFAMKQTVFE